MTDRELIELAAKAAGYKILMWNPHINKYAIDQGYSMWNPLTDDGDALRLAVELEISVKQYKASVEAMRAGLGMVISQEMTLPVERMYATRRAITRAAALIGKEMGK